jgi:putative ABC transport system ATP-binding protein
MIVAQQLAKTYLSGGRPLPVLHDVDLEIEAEGIVAIVGPSGSGKTTLLGLLAGLDTPTSGRVLLAGEDIFALTEDERARFRARHVGFVFQTFHLLPTLTAMENVLVPFELLGPERPADYRDRARALLDRVGLSERMHHYPNQLSGGEQQRVGIARAVVHKPDLLLADEPTGNLDAQLSAEIMKLFGEFNSVGVTVLVATHDIPLVHEFGLREIVLSEGRIASDGVPRPQQEHQS